MRIFTIIIIVNRSRHMHGYLVIQCIKSPSYKYNGQWSLYLYYLACMYIITSNFDYNLSINRLFSQSDRATDNIERKKCY